MGSSGSVSSVGGNESRADTALTEEACAWMQRLFGSADAAQRGDEHHGTGGLSSRRPASWLDADGQLGRARECPQLERRQAAPLRAFAVRQHAKRDRSASLRERPELIVASRRWG